jgi:hypothetical protein
MTVGGAAANTGGRGKQTAVTVTAAVLALLIGVGVGVAASAHRTSTVRDQRDAARASVTQAQQQAQQSAADAAKARQQVQADAKAQAACTALSHAATVVEAKWAAFVAATQTIAQLPDGSPAEAADEAKAEQAYSEVETAVAQATTAADGCRSAGG